MRTKWYTFVIAGVAALFGISLTRNWFGYRDKSILWKVVKSVIDTTIVILVAEWLPIVLAGWTMVWITRPAKDPMIKVVISAVVGLLIYGVLMESGFEIIMITGIFAIDLVTGGTGFLRRLKEVEDGNITP
jgi:hypothetical protein